MSVAAASSSAFQAHNQGAVTTPQAIQKAKEDFMAFFKSDKFEEVAGHTITFRDALVRIQNDNQGKENLAFAKGWGTLFSEIIQQAEEAGYLNEGVGEVFFADDVDQVSFVADLVKQIIACVEAQGEVVPPTVEEAAYAKEQMIEFMNSEHFAAASITQSDDFEELVGSLGKFQKLLADIGKRSDGDGFDAMLVDQEDSMCYYRLFTNLIKNAVENQFLDKKVGTIFFNPKFDQISFIQSLVDRKFVVFKQ